MKKQTLVDHINAFGDAKAAGNPTLTSIAANALSGMLIRLPEEIATQADLDAQAEPQADETTAANAKLVSDMPCEAAEGKPG